MKMWNSSTGGRLLRTLRGILLAIACLAGAGLLSGRPQEGAPARKAEPAPQSGQQPQPGQQKDDQSFKIGVEVNLVSVPVTVRTRSGAFVKSLPKSAFRVLEDGVEQEIELFAQEGVPVRIAIVLDISGSVRDEWGSIKFSTRKFAENLKPEDQFALVTFNTETRLKMNWSRNHDRIDPILTSVFCKGNTNLWDALWVVCNDLFKGVTEKKAIIIMSDGLDNGSSVSYEEALSAAVHSEAAVYVVSKTQAVKEAIIAASRNAGYYDYIPQEAFMQADLAMRKFAWETGGRVLYPNSFGQLGNVYADVDEELRNQYTVGYLSSNQAKDGSYRKIQVLVDAPDAYVSARPGYYARKQ